MYVEQGVQLKKVKNGNAASVPLYRRSHKNKEKNGV